ncbi:efflux RND transporter periplasmic adaptor subunit [Propionivibrio sp.]|uniref:efflux RND transporter periplasmic adaptor subunit n=1 Tax=Propionivibrio sp. TaxID=2212460 RepID=UPI0039E5999E
MVPVLRSFTLVSLVLMAACSPDKPAVTAPPPEVGVVTVAPRPVPYSASFVAQTESSRQVEILARVAGFLDRIAYAEGDFVKEGQLLFQIDPKPFKAQLDAAQGSLAAQKARLSTAEATLKRVRPLAEQNALSQADLDRAVGDFEMAEAAVHTAIAKLREAELNLDYATIRSPVSGSAGRALQREGAYVGGSAETAKLTYVAALDPIWVTFSISQNQSATLAEMVEKKLLTPPERNSYEVELVLPGDKIYPYRGRINFADPSFSQETGAFMVRASVPNPKKELRPGMFVTVNMHGAIRPDAVVVPQLALQQGAKGHFVLVANAEDKVEIRPVVVGSYAGDKEIVVEQGLHAGDRVIVDGFARLTPNAPVKPVPAAAAPTTAQAAGQAPAAK